eukprot:scaffold10_cov257-Pinguiococcus_pyrenoidosus.AAC.52
MRSSCVAKPPSSDTDQIPIQLSTENERRQRAEGAQRSNTHLAAQRLAWRSPALGAPSQPLPLSSAHQ